MLPERDLWCEGEGGYNYFCCIPYGSWLLSITRNLTFLKTRDHLKLCLLSLVMGIEVKSDKLFGIEINQPLTFRKHENIDNTMRSVDHLNKKHQNHQWNFWNQNNVKIDQSHHIEIMFDGTSKWYLTRCQKTHKTHKTYKMRCLPPKIVSNVLWVHTNFNKMYFSLFRFFAFGTINT